MPVRVTIHQPEHLPWLGFLAKAASADCFILLDTVPYRHHYFQNRNRVLANGAPVWLTVPVKHRGHLQTAIAEMEIDNSRPWKRKYIGRLEDAYRRAPQGDEVIPPLRRLIERAESRLLDLNLAIMGWLFGIFAITTRTILASELPRRGTRSELLASLADAVGASTYLSGPSGREYLDRSAFVGSGIAVEFYDFAHPSYPQGPTREFVPNLSAIDLIAHRGTEGSREVLASAVSASSLSRE
jgi:hypothetical protein